jgi:hypothetical protein
VAGKPFYRVLRGLDPYSDRLCGLLVRRLTARTPIGAGASVAVSTVAALMLTLAWVVGGAVLGPLACAVLNGSSGSEGPSSNWQLGGAAAGGVIGFVVSYRAVSRGMALSALRDALRPRIIDGSKCMICRYSLEGLTGRDNLVVCPECGRTVPIGLGAVDLVEQMMVRGELPPEGRFALRPTAGGPSNPGGGPHE